MAVAPHGSHLDTTEHHPGGINGHYDDHGNPVYHQYEDYEQQTESYIVGMWTFLVTEVMFFGAFFVAYILYRSAYQKDFFIAQHDLDWRIGAVNTVVLLFSSFTMACAVHFAQKKMRKQQLTMIGITTVCAVLFLIIKIKFEWMVKWDHHHTPLNWEWHNPAAVAEHAKMFFALYFGLTGLHGIHVLIGIIVFAALAIMTVKKHPLTEDYVPTEMVGLYWHFVDIVWIFLFPLFYLMPE